ncbi:GlsB/YeaQ/YmgE family stress response membrane protein [Paucilactobacillus kaifaensis]|uniref:GlsB/YeaQ/YmgE family stress response membrane protein n=1 Tax=Paucilactobacillus kaifaensis TaxID=2559921 RepID=UPI0010F8964A|nr:GlsB/YeaQ/YmgE family stress response membrane protein [Paucilactobacillus kaifaensis]
MQTLWTLAIGGIIGILAGVLTNRNLPMGWVGNIMAGLAGAWLGEMLFGTWGPQLAGVSLLPAILGAVILVVAVSIILKLTK